MARKTKIETHDQIDTEDATRRRDDASTAIDDAEKDFAKTTSSKKFVPDWLKDQEGAPSLPAVEEEPAVIIAARGE
jgi:hypothetical protein